MSKLRDAAQQALEALEQLQGGCTDHDDGTVEAITVWCPEIIDALRAALAEQPAEQEPVAWWHRKSNTFTSGNLVSNFAEWAPLYTAPHLVRAQTLEEVEKKVPGGKHTDKWESCRIADYNQGWNDYRKQCAAAIRAMKEQT